MTNWPLEGGVTGIVSVDRNLRGILRRGGNLLNEAQELFPQLVTPGARKLGFGTVTVTFTAATSSAGAVVTHGLGVTPTSVVVAQQGIELGGLYARSEALGATTFKVVGFSPFGVVSGTAVFAWIAIG